MPLKTRRRRRRVNPPAPKANPPLAEDIAEIIIPGFASFAGTRLATRVAVTQIAKIKPNLGKHAGAGVSIGAFLAAWFLAHKWKFLAKYHTGVVVGSTIAALQSLIQLYMPSLGWVVSDAQPAPALPAGQPSAGGGFASQAEIDRLRLREVDDDPNEFTFDESFDAGRYSPPMPPKGSKVQEDPQAHMAGDMAEDLGDLDLGTLSN